VLDPADPTTVKIPASLLGMIFYLGPTYNEIISSFERASDWEETIEQELVNHKPESQHEQSDLFLEALEVVNEEVLNARLSRSQKIAWRRSNIDNERSVQYYSSMDNICRSKCKRNTSKHPRTSSTLFLIKDETMASPPNTDRNCL
jgi:hypothetical protein